ncbi:MAG: hypothetical protein U7123_04355 [Potamolinea sp.]
MSAASRYWKLVKIDAAGGRKIEEIADAKQFLLSSFPEFIAQSEVPDALIQRKLMYLMREGNLEGTSTTYPASKTSIQLLAETCLQCFVSTQIERVCQQLTAQFGVAHGFTYSDLLPLVLDDIGNRQKGNSTNSIKSSYQSLLSEILQSFDPEQSSLATWTTRRVKHHKELNAFLLERGVYLVSDWAILNDTSPKQLQRIFLEFHQLTATEIQQAKELLESYHAVYRTQRIKQRQQGIKGQCSPPTTEQLQKIGMNLSSQINQKFSPETVMKKLQKIAAHLREYRIYVRGGSLPTEPLELTHPGGLSDHNQSLDIPDNRDFEDEQSEFLKLYHQQFLNCLDEAIAKVTSERARQLQRKESLRVQKFLTALKLFHCQGRSMTEIAKIVNLQAQYQVTRLLQLKSFRADVQQHLLVLLRDRVLEQAKAYTDPKRLQNLHQQIEDALNEQINMVIQEAIIEASTGTNHSPNSLFSQRLCRHLDTTKNQP